MDDVDLLDHRSPVPSLDDPELKLLVPVDDVANPELSIVVPALNEELTVEDFIAWCKKGLADAGIAGEILIIDSSSDRTSELAVQSGARVLKTPKRGLGRAYIDAIPFIRGKYVIMGDADCTYDFRELKPFVAKFHEGYEFIMGSRFRGYIEPQSMPALHRYFGTPITTWILNVLYSSKFSDIHCGMRGITLEGLKAMGLSSQSWEYASEMVLKSVHLGLKTTEVPVRFLKDKEGRVSHHKRQGWFSPWQAAWINLKAMFIHGADFFLFKPGIFVLGLGLIVSIALAAGPVTIGRVKFSLYTELLGVTLSLVGLQSFYLGVLAQTFYDYSGKVRRRWLERFKYNRAVGLSAGLFLVGVGLASFLGKEFFHRGLSLPNEVGRIHHMAVMGLLLMLFSFMTFTFTLILHASSIRKQS